MSDSLSNPERLIRHDGITEPKLLEAFSQMKPIGLVELRDAFERAKPIVLNLARTVSQA